MMKNFFLILTTGLFAMTLSVQAQDNTLTPEEKKEGWKLIFDGKTTRGWRNYNSDKIGEAWKVKDGVLFLDDSKKNGDKILNAGNIVTMGEYENYELSIDWKISACGNSGILFNVVESAQIDEPWKTGPEMQVLDNSCHPDAKIIKHQAGNLYDLIASTSVSVKPAGEWNVARIISNKGHLELWLNNVKQVETTMFTPEWENLIKGSKFRDLPSFGKAKKGRISLQDHNNKVSFRNIKIREIR